MPRRPTKLVDALSRRYPGVDEPLEAIKSGRVAVDGRIVTNPASMVGAGSTITLVTSTPLRGEAKLQAALEAFRVPVPGSVALDAGAAAGGFTRTLLNHGARRVYAVDAGHGQLLGSLRQDPRVINLEATNLGSLTRRLVPEAIDLITLDLSYLSLADAVPQLERIEMAPEAHLIALVKPMFELHLPRPPEDSQRLEAARVAAIEGIEASGWRVLSSVTSPVAGSRGAREFLLHARRDAAGRGR